MKKKLLISFMILLSVFIITGCEKKETNKDSLHKSEFLDMRYNEPKNYSKKEPFELDDYKMINYSYAEDEDKAINLYVYKNSKIDEKEDLSYKYETKKINGYEWRIFHAKDFGIEYDTCDIEYKGNVYRIELNVTDKYQKEFDEFMEGVSFE